ncbi:MAG: hypothetical protein ACRDZ4_08690 [Egibacteraceae bacterium]
MAAHAVPDVVGGTAPYPWPFDGQLHPSRLALVVAGQPCDDEPVQPCRVMGLSWPRLITGFEGYPAGSSWSRVRPLPTSRSNVLIGKFDFACARLTRGEVGDLPRRSPVARIVIGDEDLLARNPTLESLSSSPGPCRAL